MSRTGASEPTAHLRARLAGERVRATLTDLADRWHDKPAELSDAEQRIRDLATDLVRYAGAVQELLARHPVDEKGRCWRCRRRWWQRKQQCDLHRLLWYFTTTHADVVWWNVLNEVQRRTVGLEEVREWLEGRAADTSEGPEDEGYDEQAGGLVADAQAEGEGAADDQPETQNYGRHAMRDERA